MAKTFCRKVKQDNYNRLHFDAFTLGECTIVDNAPVPSSNPYGNYPAAVIADSARLSILSPNDNEVSYFRHKGEVFLADFVHRELPGARAMITKNSNFCDNSFQALLDGLGSDKVIWWHIWENPDPAGDDYFFIRHNFKE